VIGRIHTNPVRRGLTLVELMIALAITVLIGAALVTLLHAVAFATEASVETREIVVRAHAIDSRLSLYTDPALAVLDVRDDGAGIALWLADTRANDVVNATEIRWLEYDAETGTITVRYVDFPDDWSEELLDLWDLEYDATAHAVGDAWWTVLDDHAAMEHISEVLLADHLVGLTLSVPEGGAYEASRFDLTYQFEDTDGDVVSILAVAALEDHMAPQ
jgi:prepilin-type N-terminal cleavage/methylation domain-containing protein